MASPTQWTWVWVNSGSWWWMGGLACCSPWGCKEWDVTERLNWTELNKANSMSHWGSRIVLFGLLLSLPDLVGHVTWASHLGKTCTWFKVLLLPSGKSQQFSLCTEACKFCSSSCFLDFNYSNKLAWKGGRRKETVISCLTGQFWNPLSLGWHCFSAQNCFLETRQARLHSCLAPATSATLLCCQPHD